MAPQRGLKTPLNPPYQKEERGETTAVVNTAAVVDTTAVVKPSGGCFDRFGGKPNGQLLALATAVALSAVLVDGSFDGTACLGEIIRHHHWMTLNARIKREEPRLGNRWDL